MSAAGATARSVPAAPRLRRPIAYAPPRSRPLVRLATFSALAGYGVLRWAALLVPAPGWRLFGVLGLGIAVAGAAPLARRVHRLLPALLVAGAVLIAFPLSGLPWHWFVHHKIALSARMIGNGLAGLPSATVPYIGHSHDVRLVIVLGVVVLVLDAAAVLAFTPGPLGDARRAAAALPLLALAVVPCTLIRPNLPYLQGFVLFGLLAAFAWGERVEEPSAVTAVVIAVAAGVGAAVVAPRIDQRHALINYRAWAAAPAHRKLDSFSWNQTYGPLNWPSSGHMVLTVTARYGDYWKAEDLDSFNGKAWVNAPASNEPQLPAPSVSARAQWTQRIRVTIEGMRTRQVIAAGYAGVPSFGPQGVAPPAPAIQFGADPPHPMLGGGSAPAVLAFGPRPAVSGGVAVGSDPGTFVAAQNLGPGATYTFNSYSPRPTPKQLEADHGSYPAYELSDFLSLKIPMSGLPPGRSAASLYPVVTFPLFDHAGNPSSVTPSYMPDASPVIENSPYGPVYALAQRLAAHAATPFAYAVAIERYLSVEHGFSYNQHPPKSAYPLVTFLLHNHEGYCQQFSGAMAMLLRMGGVPARVAAGFTSGTHDPITGQWNVVDIDAHAWVEAWFPGYGWYRFDPTPATAPARADSTPLPIEKSLAGLNGQLPAKSHHDVPLPVTKIPTTHAAGHGGDPLPVVLAVAAVLLFAGGLWALLKGPRSADAMLSELERAMARTRRPIPDGVTLAEIEYRLRSAPAAAGYIRALRMARYAGRGQRPTSAQRRALRRELAVGLGFVGRIRALWALPPRLRLRRRRFPTSA